MQAILRTIALIAAMLSPSPCASAFALPQQSKEAKEPTGSIAGRVTVEGKAVSNITVMLTPSETGPLRQPAAKVATDEEGRYQFTKVAAGTYSVQPHAPMFVIPNEGYRGLLGKAVVVEDGEATDGINLSLTRGGVITGRVSDANGRPLVEERLTLLRITDNGQKQPVYMPYFSMMSTDDRGVYRIFGVAAGRYIIGAGIKPEEMGVRVGFGNTFYTRTYHPNAADDANAEIFEVTPGGEVTGVDITVGRPTKTYAATGRIVDANTGQPLSDITYGFGKPSTDGKYIGSYAMSGARSNSKGEFRVEGLSPGKYVAITTSESNEQTAFYSEPATFDIVDGDVSGLEIKVHRGSSVSGVVLLEEAASEEAQAKFSQLQLGLNVESQQLLSPRNNSVKPGLDGSFSIIGLPPGRARFHVSGYPPVKGFTIKRVERDGVEQTGGIEIAAGERISDVKLFLSYGNGSIRGQIKIEGGPLPEGARLMIIHNRKDENPPRPVIPVQPDARGHFVIGGLTPGEYEVFSLDSISIPNRPPLRAKTEKQTVMVSAGEETQVTITIKLNAKDDSQR